MSVSEVKRLSGEMIGVLKSVRTELKSEYAQKKALDTKTLMGIMHLLLELDNFRGDIASELEVIKELLDVYLPGSNK